MMKNAKFCVHIVMSTLNAVAGVCVFSAETVLAITFDSLVQISPRSKRWKTNAIYHKMKLVSGDEYIVITSIIHEHCAYLLMLSCADIYDVENVNYN